MESVLANGKWEKGWVRQMGYFLLIFRYYFEAVSLLDPSGYWVSKPSEWCAGFLSWLQSKNLHGNTLPHRALDFPFPPFPLSFIVRAPGLPFHVSCKHLKSALGCFIESLGREREKERKNLELMYDNNVGKLLCLPLVQECWAEAYLSHNVLYSWI